MRISVIVPTYNSESSIERCVESILLQTQKNIEIVIVDDCSTDSTVAVLENICTKNDDIVLVRREVNGGQVAAYLDGIARATGDLIGFVDSDDYIHPRMFELLYQSITAHESDCSACGCYLVDGNKCIVEPDNCNDFNDSVYDSDQLRQSLYSFRYEKNCISHVLRFYRCNKLFRREIIDRAACYTDDSIRVFEDNLFTTVCFLEASTISYVGIPLYYYQRNIGSTMRFFDISLLESNIRVIKQLAIVYRDYQLDHDFDADRLFYSTHVIRRLLQSSHQYKFKKDALKRVHDDLRDNITDFSKSARMDISAREKTLLRLTYWGCYSLLLLVYSFKRSSGSQL